MALTLVQAGTSLQLIHEDGTIQTLTLPTGVSLRTDVLPRWAMFNNYLVMVNTPDQPLTIDQYGVVRLLCPRPPRTAALIAGTVSGVLSGTYKDKYTFFELDAFGGLIYESDYGPVSNTITIATKKIDLAQLDLMPNSTTNGRRQYRTTSGTDTYFQWFDLDNNTSTTAQDDTPDAGISSFAAPARGTPPYLTHVAEFRGRLFGVGADANDVLRYTEVDEMFAWPGDNEFQVPHVGSDQIGITALVPRRDALGIGRQTCFLQLTGTDDSNFRIVKLSENTGVASQESVVVYRDTAYFLWYDGVYSWDANGITCLSDGKVRSWFTKDDTFNRAMFEQAFAVFDPNRRRYLLALASVGSDVIDRWIEYDIESGTWWGPHLSDAYSITSAFTIFRAGNVPQYAFGASEDVVVIDQETRTDGNVKGIPVSATLAPIFGESTDMTTYFGQPTILTKAQPNQGDLTVTTAVGEPGALVAADPETVTLDVDRQRLGRIGVGRACTLTFEHDTRDEKLEIGGIEIPFNTPGRR